MYNQIIDSKMVQVQTHSWERYGNIIFNPMDALKEIVHNAYAATMGDSIKRIAIDIIAEHGDKYLCVKNSGHHADLEKVLHYGKKNHGSVLNQFGTGFKTAASFFNPENDGWEFFTRDDEKVFRVSAPYSNEMEIQTIEGWPFEDWAVSCVKIKVSELEKLDGIDAEALGYHYSLAIKKDNLKITFNDSEVMPVEPKGGASSDSEIVDICGVPVKINYTLYNLGKDSDGERFYPMGLAGQGIYIFANHCFAKYVGPSIIQKSGIGNTPMKAHPSMNHLIAVIDIETPEDHSADIPFINCKNEINWRSKMGQAYRKAIDDLVGNHFRNTYDNEMEKERRKFLDNFCKTLLNGVAEYDIEYKISKDLRADAVIASQRDAKGKIIPSSIQKIIEYKKGNITSENVGQAFGYYIQLETHHQSKPAIMLIGKTLTPGAEDYIRKLQSFGIEVQFFNWSKYQLG